MADIFISYSSKDKKKAVQLSELLVSAGFSVWIDHSGIDIATSWSKEIASALVKCKVMLLLLSENSIASRNVAKELSVASELQKHIIPVELEQVRLTGDFLYHLSALQRTNISNISGIISAIEKLNAETKPSTSSSAPKKKIPVRKRSRMRLIWMSAGFILIAAAAYFLLFSKNPSAEITGPRTIAVLPFENLSSDKENEYFADGMTATLIDMLVPIPGLKVVDRKTAMEYKGSKKNLKAIAEELGVRYIVDGSIQKQGSTIKINIQLTDVQTGKILKSKTFDGTTTDLMAIQEQIARGIVYELQLAFNPSGVSLPPDVTSRVPEAYNLCMIGGAIGTGSSKSIHLAISYFLQAVKLDTAFAFAYLSIARQYGNLQAIYPDSAKVNRWLILADSFFVIGKRLDTGNVNQHYVGSFLATVHRDFATAVAEANLYLQKRPEDYRGYMVLALAYEAQDKKELAAANWEETIKRNSMHFDALYNLCVDLYILEDSVRLRKYCAQAIPLFRLATVRHPDDEDLWLNLTWLLSVGGHGDEACRRMDERIKPPGDTPNNLVYAACVYALNNNVQQAMNLLRAAVQKGDLLKLTLDQSPFKNLRPLPEYQALLKKQKEARAKNKKNNG